MDTATTLKLNVRQGMLFCRIASFYFFSGIYLEEGDGTEYFKTHVRNPVCGNACEARVDVSIVEGALEICE